MSLLSPMSPPIVLPDGVGNPLDMIALTGMTVDCLIGLYPSERDVPQPLNLDVWLFLDTRHAAHSGSLRYSVDYARLAGELRFLLESCQFLLLETAADALCHYLLAPGTDDAPRAPLKAVALRLSKPHALNAVVQPALTVWRRAEEVVERHENRSYGQVDVLYQTRGCGIYRVRVAPGRSFVTCDTGQGLITGAVAGTSMGSGTPSSQAVSPQGGAAHALSTLRRELALGDGLTLFGRSLVPGTAVGGPSGVSRRYHNPQVSAQSLLCVHRPAQLPDEGDPGSAPGPEGVQGSQQVWPAGLRCQPYYPHEDQVPREPHSSS